MSRQFIRFTKWRGQECHKPVWGVIHRPWSSVDLIVWDGLIAKQRRLVARIGWDRWGFGANGSEPEAWTFVNEEDVPGEVWAELAKRVLLNED